MILHVDGLATKSVVTAELPEKTSGPHTVLGTIISMTDQPHRAPRHNAGSVTQRLERLCRKPLLAAGLQSPARNSAKRPTPQ